MVSRLLLSTVSLLLIYQVTGLIEPPGYACKTFESVSAPLIANAEGHCTTNKCPGGCCRYDWTIFCDTTDEKPYLRCICNENTANVTITAQPTAEPTNPPTELPTEASTEAPTEPPTEAPTEDEGSSRGADICIGYRQECVSNPGEFELGCCSGTFCIHGKCLANLKENRAKLSGQTRGGAAGGVDGISVSSTGSGSGGVGHRHRVRGRRDL